MKKVEIQSEILIMRPLEEVVGYVADPVNAPQWYQNIHKTEWKSEALLQAGSQVAFHANFMNREVHFLYEITEWDPKRILAMRTLEGPFPLETIYQWESLGDSETHMRLRNVGKPTGMLSLMAPMISSAIQKATEKDLALLKEILESR